MSSGADAAGFSSEEMSSLEFVSPSSGLTGRVEASVERSIQSEESSLSMQSGEVMQLRWSILKAAGGMVKRHNLQLGTLLVSPH